MRKPAVFLVALSFPLFPTLMARTPARAGLRAIPPLLVAAALLLLGLHELLLRRARGR